MNRSIITFLIICSLCVSCNPDEDVQPAEGLRHNWDFPVGVALTDYAIDRTTTDYQLILKHFDRITPENALKMENTWLDQKHSPDSKPWMLRSVKTEDLQFHGHPLVWHNQLPDWLDSFEGDATAWDDLLRTYITSVVSFFGNSAQSWDVVNEAFLEDGSLRNTIWKKHLGNAYIEKAFQYAHEANPNALLFYNDYNLASSPKKLKAVLTYFTRLRQRGVPVHGIGMQMHIAINYPENHLIDDAFHAVISSDFKLHVSELDISVNPFGREITTANEEMLHRQRDKYLAIFTMYSRIPTHYQHGITVWGLKDTDSWIPGHFNRTDFPLLFNPDYTHKPALNALLQK